MVRCFTNMEQFFLNFRTEFFHTTCLYLSIQPTTKTKGVGTKDMPHPLACMSHTYIPGGSGAGPIGGGGILKKKIT